MNNDIKEILGIRLRHLRKEKSLTQIEICKLINKAQSTYAEYETGRKEPDLDTLKILAEYYNTSIDYMIGRY